MLKRTITYVDYDGETRSEVFYFNLNKAEAAEMDMRAEGGIQKLITKIVEEKDQNKIVDMFKEFILKSYGEKSSDGKRFVKSPELSKAFSETEAYVELFILLATDAKEAAEFVTAVLPKPVAEEPTPAS